MEMLKIPTFHKMKKHKKWAITKRYIVTFIVKFTTNILFRETIFARSERFQNNKRLYHSSCYKHNLVTFYCQKYIQELTTSIS